LAKIAEEAARMKIEFNTKCKLYVEFFDKENQNYQRLSEKAKEHIKSKFGDPISDVIDRVEEIFLNQI
jgi:hypothetical protein